MADRQTRVPWQPLLLLGVPLVLTVVGPWFGLGRALQNALSWIETLGPTGHLAFFAFYVAVTVAGLPVTWLVVAGGALFGPGRGLLLVTAGGLVGASLAFAIARRLGRPAALRWLAGRAGWERVEPLLKAHGGPIVALVRFLPGIPFSLQNYAFGLSGIGFGTYLFWTAVGIVPAGAVAVLGSAALMKSLAGGSSLGLWAAALGLGMGLGLLHWSMRRLVKVKEQPKVPRRPGRP